MPTRTLLSFGILCAWSAATFATVAEPTSSKAGTYDAHTKAACTNCVRYTSFAGNSFDLHRLPGRWVELLYPAALVGNRRTNAAALDRFVDSADLVYATFVEWIGAEPLGDGRLSIALIPPPDAAAIGRGWQGRKGIEIYESIDGFPAEIESSAAAGRLDQLVVHEMTHNFDLTRLIAADTADPAHFLTAILPRLYERHHRWNSATAAPPGDLYLQHRTSEEILERFGYHRFRWMIEGHDRSVRQCVLEGGCGIASSNSLAAAIVFRAASANAPDFLPKYFRATRELAAARSDAARATVSLDAQLVALSRAGGRDLLCLAPAFGWTASAEYVQRLAADRLPRSALCDDADGDGAVGFLDPDDARASVKFAADDVLDGVDNDGDGVVDERYVDADSYRLHPATSYPVAIAGTVAAAGSTEFVLPPLTGERARVELCTDATFVLDATLSRGRAGLGAGPYAGGPGASHIACVHAEVGLAPRTQDGPVRLRIDSTGDAPATFRAVVSPLAGTLPPPAALTLDRVLLDGVDVVRYRRVEVAALPAGTRARLWIAGEGFAAEQAAEADGRFVLPAVYAGRTVSARVQLALDGAALATSEPLLLPAAMPPRGFDDFAGGVFGDPARSGEGWQISPGRIGDARVLFVSFYAQLREVLDPDAARAPWFFGVAPFPSGRDSLDLTLFATGSGSAGFSGASDEPYPAMVASLTRLGDGRLRATAIAGNGETSQALLQPIVPASTNALAGIWTRPGVAGEGLFVQAIQLSGGPGVVVAWFGYCGTLASAPLRCDQRPHWLVGTARTIDGHADVELFEAVGGEFGVLQDAALSRTTARGHATLAAIDCERLALVYRDDAKTPLEVTLSRSARFDGIEACDGD
jgi:hypothetical protein